MSLASPAGICASIAGKQVDDALAMAARSEPHADVIEIRLDTLAKPAVMPFIDKLNKPVLFTNRPVWEGGSCEGPEGERVALLLEAIKSDCGLVDLELKAAPELRAEILDGLLEHDRTGLIISWHDFSGTPSSEELADILRQQMESGAHIGKIVTMAHSYNDVLRVLNLQTLAAENNFPLIAFCMGPVGTISRLATLKLGGYMTYGAPVGGEETAPGQLEVSVLQAMLKTIAGATIKESE